MTLTQEELKKILHRHQLWLEDKEGGEQANLSWADLRGANLCEADLRWANLREADLCGADLDFSCWPLWCGSLDVTVDKRIAAQLAYHFCRVRCDDPEVQAAQKALAPLANQFHRVEECGRIAE